MGVGVGKAGILLRGALRGLRRLLCLLHRFLGVVIEMGGLERQDHRDVGGYSNKGAYGCVVKSALGGM